MNDAKPSVLKNYPKAYAVCQRIHWPRWLIYTPLWRGIALMGRGVTEAEAWEDAVNFGRDTSKR